MGVGRKHLVDDGGVRGPPPGSSGREEGLGDGAVPLRRVEPEVHRAELQLPALALVLQLHLKNKQTQRTYKRGCLKFKYEGSYNIQMHNTTQLEVVFYY